MKLPPLPTCNYGRDTFQFRTEALNAFNSPYFYSPNTNLSSGTFGQINSQANFARQLQLALRVSF